MFCMPTRLLNAPPVEDVPCDKPEDVLCCQEGDLSCTGNGWSCGDREGREFLGRRPALESHGEVLEVVVVLPAVEPGSGLGDDTERLAVPELLAVIARRV